MAENTDTLEVLKQLAQQVRNATAEGENTAERVGRTMVGIIDHLGDGDSITEGMLDEKLEDYPTKQEVTIAMSRYVTTDFFARLFAPEGEDGAEVDVNDMEAVINAVRVKFGLHTDSYISAKGNNPESGSTVAGASALVDLSDVDISNPQDGQIFAWDAARQKWVNADAPSAGLDEAALAEYLTTNHYAKTTDIPSLEGYATQTWASGQFALKTVAINAGTGLTGGGTLAASRTLSLATVGTAGTYTKVTVDAYGRVTGHASLAAGDIPALAISKITGLQDALDAKMDASQLSNLYRKRTDNAVTVSKALSALVAENDSDDAWNVPANTVLMLSNSNNALAFHLGGTMNERAANIQTGHNSPSYATGLGMLYLNKLGGNVMVGEPSAVAKFNVEGGIYATSYLQVGGGRLRWDSANNALYVQKSDGSVCGFYATGFVSTKGANGDAGSAVAGVTELSELEDVTISSPVNGQALVYRNGVWKNEAIETGLDETALAEYLTTNQYAKKSDIPSLSGYATQTWVNAQLGSYATTSAMNSALAGKADKTITITAGTGLTGGGTLSANRTIALATVGTAGTYTKVTVDAYGRVTGHASLAAGDIPALAISKITGLQDALDAKMDASQLSNLYRKRTDNAVTVSKALSALVAENDSDDAWNVPANTVLMLSNSNNALAFHLGGTMNERAANIQTGHNSPSYATGLGMLYLNKLGGNVMVGEPSAVAKFNVEGGIYATSYLQVGGGRLRWDSANNALYVQKSDGSVCGFYATGFVSTKGANGDAGSAVAGVTELSELEDVTISSPVNGQALVYRNGVWKNEAIETGLTSVSWDDVTGKPTTLAGYGITDAPTKTGGGASGTWGISITGNAATASNAGKLNGLSTSETGNRWGVIPFVEADGVMEVGRYIDFHYTDADTSDYGVRLGMPDTSGVTLTLPSASGTLARTTDNVYSATRLQTARSINGTAFDGTESITTSKWGMARTLTLKGAVTGSVSIDGSGNVSLETTYATGNISALDNRYVNVGGDTMTGALTVDLGSGTKLVLGNGIQIWATSGGWARGLVAYDASGDSALANGSICGAYGSGNTLQYTYYGGTYDSPAMVIRGGNVGIGTTSPSHKLHVAGGIYSSDYLQVGSARLRWDSATGALYVQKSDGTACGFYATGFVSAKGANDDDTPTEATVLTIADERDATIYPNTYGRGVWAFFRSNNADGLNDGGTYHTVLHIRQWANSSGGLSHQLAFTDNGGVWHRTALSETAWGEWSELSALSGLGDVSISNPVNGQALIYRDGVWKNETVNYGITMDVDWDDVKNKPAWIGSTKPSYSFSEITGTPSVTVSSSSSTNLSVSVEGSGRTVPSLYATYLGGTTKQGLFTGLTYSSNKLSVTIGGTTKSVTINAGGGSSLANVSDDSSGIVVKATSGTFVSIVGQSKPFYIDSQSGQTVGLRFGRNAATGVGVNMEAFKPLSAAAGNLYLGTSAARWRTVYSVNSLNTSSDLRLKDVRAAIPLTVAQVAAAPSFLYRWKKGADTAIHAGSSAQYWQQALPQAVTEGADGYLAMQYDKAALAAAIATARAVADHETRIRRLEQQLDKTAVPTT